ncbi:MAG: AI-2E family transporter [Nanoarchaeota archaeon]|nr:AI-2E family transporter [Nanoarchaeota archaeon]
MSYLQKNFLKVLVLLVGCALLLPLYKVLLTSVVFAYAVYPSKKFFKKIVKNNSLASLFCTVFWIIIVVYIIVLLGNIILFAVSDAQEIINSEMFVNLTNDVKDAFASNQISSVLIESVNLQNFVSLIASKISPLLAVAPMMIIYASLVVIFSYYFLKDGESMIDFVLSQFSPNNKKRILALLKKVNLVFANIIYGYILTAIIIGILVFTIFTLLGVPNSFLLAVLSTVLSIIPLAGPIIPSLIAGISLLLSESYFKILLLFIFNVGLSFVDNIIRAFISDKGLKEYSLHPLLFICGVVSGSVIFGPVGLIAGPMFFGAVSVLLKEMK